MGIKDLKFFIVTQLLLICLGFALAFDDSLSQNSKSECLTKMDALGLKQEMKSMVHSSLKKMAKTIDKLKHELHQKTSAENQVPIGFIYIQLPNQYSPDVIWPSVTWMEVTQHYAGLFFRAEGGASLPFGSTQPDSQRRISQMQYGEKKSKPYYPDHVNIPASGWSEAGKVGMLFEEGEAKSEGLKFYSTDDEVRPRNTAIRIWTRTM